MLISGDLGFSNILSFPPGSHGGIIVTRIPNEMNTHLGNEIILQALRDLSAPGVVRQVKTEKRIFAQPGLTVQAAAPAQLLAMKLTAWRDDLDIDDARLLLSQLEGERDEVWGQIEPFLVPGRKLKAQYAFADLWEAEHGHS